MDKKESRWQLNSQTFIKPDYSKRILSKTILKTDFETFYQVNISEKRFGIN
ncbi:hypothetical protein BH11BAC3_BH11BAC3_32920 [soil metagenome]